MISSRRPASCQKSLKHCGDSSCPTLQDSCLANLTQQTSAISACQLIAWSQATRYRRLTIDYEVLLTTSVAFIYAAMVRLMLRRKSVALYTFHTSSKSESSSSKVSAFLPVQFSWGSKTASLWFIKKCYIHNSSMIAIYEFKSYNNTFTNVIVS